MRFAILVSRHRAGSGGMFSSSLSGAPQAAVSVKSEMPFIENCGSESLIENCCHHSMCTIFPAAGPAA